MPTDLSAKLAACGTLAATIGLPPHHLARVRSKVERGHREHGHEPPPVAMEELPHELYDLIGYPACEMARTGEPLSWRELLCARVAAWLLWVLEGPKDQPQPWWVTLVTDTLEFARTLMPHVSVPAANGLPPHPWRPPSAYRLAWDESRPADDTDPFNLDEHFKDAEHDPPTSILTVPQRSELRTAAAEAITEALADETTDTEVD